VEVQRKRTYMHPRLGHCDGMLFVSHTTFESSNNANLYNVATTKNWFRILRKVPANGWF
jgi:hypothetical protein